LGPKERKQSPSSHGWCRGAISGIRKALPPAFTEDSRFVIKHRSLLLIIREGGPEVRRDYDSARSSPPFNHAGIDHPPKTVPIHPSMSITQNMHQDRRPIKIVETGIMDSPGDVKTASLRSHVMTRCRKRRGIRAYRKIRKRNQRSAGNQGLSFHGLPRRGRSERRPLAISKARGLGEVRAG